MKVFPFNGNTTYNTRDKRTFHSTAITSVTFGSEKLCHLPPKIWEKVPVEIKNVELVACFKRFILLNFEQAFACWVSMIHRILQ